MNTYELDENMVNWIKTRMEEYEQIPAGEFPGLATEAHIEFRDMCSEEIESWPNEKKIELGRCIWRMVWLDCKCTPEDFNFLHNLDVLESIGKFCNDLD